MCCGGGCTDWCAGGGGGSWVILVVLLAVVETTSGVVEAVATAVVATVLSMEVLAEEGGTAVLPPVGTTVCDGAGRVVLIPVLDAFETVTTSFLSE